MKGEIDFEESLRTRVRLLAGQNASTLYSSIKKMLRYKKGVEEFCNVLKRNGVLMIVVSGGFVPLAEFVQLELGLDHSFANQVNQNGIVLLFIVGRGRWSFDWRIDWSGS